MKTSTEEGEGLHGNAKMEKFPAAADVSGEGQSELGKESEIA